MLKIRTKEVLYERYRTEKLLAKRATRNISEADTKKLLEGKFQVPAAGRFTDQPSYQILVYKGTVAGMISFPFILSNYSTMFSFDGRFFHIPTLI